jgi:hypothetical protein
MTDIISVTPNPASPGDYVTICYAFGSSQNGPVTLNVMFDCHGDPIESEHVVVPREPCVVVEVPQGALGGLVEDGSGVADDCAITIV